MSPRVLLWLLFLSPPVFGVDFDHYDFEIVSHPRPITSLSAEERDRLRELLTWQIDFLFLAPCSVASEEQCLWATVDTLSEGELVWERNGDAIHLSYLRPKEWKNRKRPRAVRLCEDACPGTTVNGRTLRVTHWLFVDASKGKVYPPIPLVWVPLSRENQKKVNLDFHMSYHSGKRLVVLNYSDLQATNPDSTVGYFTVVGWNWLLSELSREPLVVYAHSIEKDTYTGHTTGSVKENEPTVEKLHGYSFVENGYGYKMSRVSLYGAGKGSALQGQMVPASVRTRVVRDGE